ncbi:hypothetical protein ACFUMH_10320 [Cellulomonas sp. NPDC057328]|uniref:hypothetical protein n=1 Tax=Cellulomonas sp. NPDC057328 TaxID=3346101 RepID=UPI00363C88AF
MTANPLVAPVVDTTTPFQGAFLLESGEALVSAIQNESWVEGGLAGFSLALDTVATAMDPLGSLIAAGLGWVMEHLQPLKGWLDDLTGDADEVASFAATWGNVSTSLAGSAAELRRVLSDLDACDGATIEAYRRFQQDAADHVAAAGDWASAMSTGMQVASVIVQVVHDLVRDAIAQVVGSVISYAAELALTLGAAAPYVAAQAASKVASLSARLMTTMTRLVRSIGSLRGIVDELGTLFRRFGDLVGPLLRRLRTLDLPGFGRSGADAPSTPARGPSDAPGTPAPGGPADPLDRWSFVDGAHQRVYGLENGGQHTTSWAPEQIDTSRTAAHVIDERLADDALFARHGLAPWSRDDLVRIVQTPVADLSSAEKAALREIADALPPPGVGDVVQKVLTNAQAQAVLDPATAAAPSSRVLSGSITRVEDSAMLDTVAGIHQGLRLDYDDVTFLPHDESVYVVRTMLGRDVAEISRFSDMGGTGRTDGWHDPYTGNGFLKSDALIPEYRIDQPAASPYLMEEGTEMWEVLQDGTQRLAAVLDDTGAWVRVR